MVITRAKKKPEKPEKAAKPVPAAATSTRKRAEKFIEQAEPDAIPMSIAKPDPIVAAEPAAEPSPPESPAATNTETAAHVAPGLEPKALALVKSYLPWAAGAAFVPVPGLDLAAIIAVQLTMLAKLSALYGVPFKDTAAKSSVASLMAILLQGTLAGGLVSATKMIPVLGTLVGIAALPAFVVAATYAIGKVFITHFESGGTFLDFEPKKVEAHFRAEFEQARKQPV